MESVFILTPTYQTCSEGAHPSLCILTCVAKALRQIFHASTFTLGGTRQFHTIFQLGFSPSGLELVAPLSCLIISRCSISRYALLTVKRPFFFGNHATKSSSLRRDGRIFSISVMSSCMKYRWRRCSSQEPSGCMKSATHRYLQRPWLDLGRWPDSRGIHGSRHARILEPFPTRQMTPSFNSSSPYSIACQVEDPFPVNTVSNKKPLG
jgi:hypothetical protein